MIKTAIVILNWNGQKLLERFLPSVVKSVGENDKIVIIDNCSTDDSVSFTKQSYPSVELIILDKNYGFAGGYNRGLKYVDTDYYVLLNSDVEVTTNWLKPLIHKLDVFSDVAVVQPKILAHRNKDYFEYAGASGGFIDHLGFPFCRGRIFDSIEKDSHQYDQEIEIFWASGACFVIRSAEFWKQDGFDEHFFAHMEEIDLCWRIFNSGLKTVCIPASVVYHVGGATLDEASPYKTYLNYRNNMLMLYKNLEPYLLTPTIRKRRIYNYIAAFKFIISGKWNHAKAIYKADNDFMKDKKRYTPMQSNPKNIKSHSLIYKRNIILDYFLRGKKKFSDLNF